jgi:hypothetical protein
VQAKEKVRIPNRVIRAVKNEFRINRKSLHHVNRARVREYLRKLDKMHQYSANPIRFSQYYEHAPLIVEKITGVPPPWLTPEQESKMRWIFCTLEPAYDAVPKHVRNGRTNFLHYSYVIYKLCELLGYTEILPNLTLLKSKQRLRQHDLIWESMMKYLKIDYHPTF